ncbi:MAG TPA: LuxR C-terminal-related transcriptional regulator [Solirubrobacteraceae bacterium]|jgi:DNA-binding NarL/FixJ family response regulator
MASGSWGILAAWPLIGRDGELERIREALAAGATGVVISGGAGLGKTRLARAALEQARDGGAHVVWARATRSSSAVPLGAFGTLSATGAQPAAEVGFIQNLVGALREQADGREIVLGVDDAQLLDPASATLLLHLAEHSVASVIVTIRAGDPCPDAVTALWKDAGSARVDLGALDDDKLSQLLDTALGGPLQHEVHRWIANSSRGNVLYAQHLVTGAIDSDALIREDGVWRLTQRPSPSPSLSELIATRMGTLSEQERRGLELLALGEPITLTEATELIGADTLAALETHELALVDPTAHGDGDTHLAHPLFGELIREQMPASRAHEHRLQLAALVAARPERSQADAVRIANWLIDAGAPVSAGTLLDAAKAANAAGIDSGGDFAQRALDAGAGPEASMLLAAAHSVHDRPAQAEAALAAVEGTIEDQTLAFAYLRERATVLQWGLGRPADAVALLDRALAWWADEQWRYQIQILRLPFAALTSEPGVTMQLERALENEALDVHARRWLTRALAVDLFWTGRVNEAQAMLAEIPQIPLRGELEFLEFATYSVINLASGADLGGLERNMRDAFEHAAECGDPAAAGLAAVTVAATSYLAGRFLDCRRWLNEAITQSERQDPFATRQLARSLQVGVSLALGDRAGAAAASQLAAEMADGTGTVNIALARRGNASWVARGQAWVMLARAESPRAQELLLHSADELAWAPVYDAELRYETMRAGRSARDLAPALQELANRCDAPLTHAYAVHTKARATGNAAGMLEAADAFVALGVNRYASEAAAHAAAAFAAEGRQDSARRAATRSRELQPTQQGATPLSIEGVDRALTDLTPREAQMVDLAARGLSNAEIAETLVLSTRTVETHIYRAMRKLGISDRREFRVQSI